MFILVVVIDGIVDGRLDTFVLVELLHLWPWVASLSNIFLGLQVENCWDSDALHVSNILVFDWVGADEDTLVFDLINVEIFEEVSVGFLDAAIDNPGITS